jgi:hypothetical protein
MFYQLYAIRPTYDDRDAIVGSSAHAHPYAFVTRDGALAVGDLYGNRPWNDGIHYVVVPQGASPYDHSKHCGRLLPLDADIPF